MIDAAGPAVSLGWAVLLPHLWVRAAARRSSSAPKTRRHAERVLPRHRAIGWWFTSSGMKNKPCRCNRMRAHWSRFSSSKIRVSPTFASERLGGRY